jgi:hypothetical protein
MGLIDLLQRAATFTYQVGRKRAPAVMAQPEPSPHRTLSWRLKISLGTLSTVLAVATGMFTLRDQIFPREAGTAHADVNVYERSVGDICDALNAAERARAKNARRLAERLRGAHTTTAQRDALLDSTKAILARSEDGLARFEGLDIPSARASRHRTTDAAWSSSLTQLRGYAERLDTVTSRRDLLAAVGTLSRMRTSLARNAVVRAAGLIALGGPNCRLDPPIVTPTLTLPGSTRTVTPTSGAAAPPPSGRPGPAPTFSAASSDPAGAAPTPSVEPAVGTSSPTPSVDPPVIAPQPSVDPPRTLVAPARSVDPPQSAAPADVPPEDAPGP